MSMPRVLVVDDEPNMRWTMGEFLKRAGYEAVQAADYDEALAALAGAEVDAAVVDIIIAVKNCIDLLKELSGLGSYVPVLLFTGEPNYVLVT